MSFEVFIEPGRSEKNYWKDLWRYRELFYILSWRDLKVRYKQTIIGVVWSVLRPLLTMMIFTFVFGQIAKFTAPPGVEYAVLVFAGLLPWQFFAAGLSESSNSLIGNERLISKVYFPRMIIPAASVITSLVDFLCYPGFLCQFWNRIMVNGTECKIPRLQTCSTFYGSTGALYFTGWIYV